jgi:hypothetical protein
LALAAGAFLAVCAAAFFLGLGLDFFDMKGWADGMGGSLQEGIQVN